MTIIELTGDQLDEKIRTAIRSEISKFQPSQPDKLLTRKEAAKMLNISLPTISSWEKSDQLKSTRIGSRVYFRQSDLMK